MHLYHLSEGVEVTVTVERKETPGGHLILEHDRYPAAFRHRTPDANLIAVLFERTADEWRRFWRTEVGWEPRREALIDVHDVSRSTTTAAAPTTHLLPGRDVALTELERPIDAGSITVTVGEFLDGGVEHDTIVYVDAVDEFLADDEAGVEAIAGLSGQLRESGASGYFCLDVANVSPDVYDRLVDATDSVRGDADGGNEISHAIAQLQREDPTNFGYAARHWREAREGIRRCSRNYPQARQIHEAIDDPETTPRTLGATLQALVSLGVIDTWGETVGATRYDLTAFDDERLRPVGEAFDEAR